MHIEVDRHVLALWVILALPSEGLVNISCEQLLANVVRLEWLISLSNDSFFREIVGASVGDCCHDLQEVVVGSA